jgi:hypothetical protein
VVKRFFPRGVFKVILVVKGLGGTTPAAAKTDIHRLYRRLPGLNRAVGEKQAG